jgi:hypothetical protein
MLPDVLRSPSGKEGTGEGASAAISLTGRIWTYAPYIGAGQGRPSSLLGRGRSHKPACTNCCNLLHACYMLRI